MREREKEESHTVLTEVLNYHPQKPTGTNKNPESGSSHNSYTKAAQDDVVKAESESFCVSPDTKPTNTGGSAC